MMRFSSQYHKRREYVKKMEVPSFTEAKKQLGGELAQVLFDDCPESLQGEMCLSDKLSGPGPNLWISPSDLLIGKVVLTPPLTATHMKALTHEGILNLGEEIEAQWLAAVNMEKQLALENLESLLMMLAARDKDRAVADALDKRDLEFKEHLEKLNAEFEELLRIELAKLEETLREYYEALMTEKANEILGEQEEYNNKQLEEAVTAAVQDLTEKFLQELEDQERELTEMFKARLQGQDERFREELNHQETVFITVMKQLKHNLQCNNISCLMYVLCMERRKCLKEQQNVVDTTQERMHELEEMNAGYQIEIERLKKDCEDKQHQLNVREDCLLGVISQFQKFINYALRAVPTQAEFLLSVEKMMTFELCQALVRTQHGKRTHLARLLMPWKSMSEDSVSLPKTLSMPNFHDCLNELKPPKCPKKGSDGEFDELYSMNYKNHVYIREDFRDRVTQGLVRETSSNLWSKEVQDLVQLIRSTHDSETIMEQSRSHTGLLTAFSSVRFLRDESVDMPDTTGLLAVRDSLPIHKSKYSNMCQKMKVKDKVDEPKTGSTSYAALLGVTDSISLIKDKGSDKLLSSNSKSDPIKPVHRYQKRKGSEWSHDLELIQAPSMNTIKLRKMGPRRMTIYSSEFTVSEATIQLNKTTRPSSDEGSLRKSSQMMSRKLSKAVSTTKPRKQSKTRQPIESYSSKFSTHKDSLELTTAPPTGNVKKLKNVIMPSDITKDPEYPTKQYVINAPSETRSFPDVNFKKIAEVFNELYTPEKPWKIYEKKIEIPPVKPRVEPPQNFLKVRNVAKVLGDKTKEENKTTKDFTIHRIHSLVEVLKTDDSLIRMFTRGGQ